LQLAARHPTIPRAIILVDGGTRTLMGPAQVTESEMALPDIMRRGTDDAPIRQALNTMFLPFSDPDLRAWVVKKMLATSRHVMASAYEQLRVVDAVSAAEACKVPVLYIQAATPRPELVRFRELCPQLMVGRTVGAGHFNMLEVPDQVNAMIARFLALHATD
jgi:pimeloyl-ACP methyl ester carboxylesterase